MAANDAYAERLGRLAISTLPYRVLMRGPTTKLLDPDTLRAARDGDREAYFVLGRWLCRLLLPYFSTYFRNRPAEEMLQNVAVDVFEKLHKASDDPIVFRDWVYGFAWTEARAAVGNDRREAARLHKLGSPELAPPRPPGPETITRKRESTALAKQCWPHLSEIHREALDHVGQGGSYRSLAASRNIPEGTARRRISDARKQLRVLIEKARRTPPELRTPT
jgi:DNA-directed RNA polymerase specialized sigma24 family protein